MDRVRRRITDKRLCNLVKAFLKAGVLNDLGDREESLTGTPQGGILTPPTQWRTWGWLLVGVTVCDRAGCEQPRVFRTGFLLVLCYFLAVQPSVVSFLRCAVSES